MIVYRIPPGIQNGKIDNLPFILNESGGKIIVDKRIISLWKAADGKNLIEIDSYSQDASLPDGIVRLAVACLAEAGLLNRDGYQSHEEGILNLQGPLVSVVIVSHNSLEWLETCLLSLTNQSYSPIEVIIVDNASEDGSADWIKKNYPRVSLIQIDKLSPLSVAINQGVLAANGEYYLLLNPDVQLKLDAIAHMVSIANEDQDCAAVAAKLRFSWAPAFLNGLGNSVGAISWGLDNGLGHLDLGQFDRWREVPSACFAAALIPKKAWDSIGSTDEGFPLYYEDSEWSYRARLQGYKVRTAPNAVVNHAFGSRLPVGVESGLSPAKLRQVVYGRLRFVTKILGSGYLLRFLCSYIVEDVVKFLYYLVLGRWQLLEALIQGWKDYLSSLPELRNERKNLQSKREVDDVDLFRMQTNIPIPLIFKGLPQLTWDSIVNIYHPLLVSGKLRSLPEFENGTAGMVPSKPSSEISRFFLRIRDIIKIEGFDGLLHRSWRYIQWMLRQP